MMSATTCDLLIVGGGLAGCAAALEAAEAGASVTLLEKLSNTGGSSAMSGGCLAFAGTDLQSDRNIDDSADLLRSDLLAIGKGENDEALVDAYVNNQLQTYEWMKAHGVEFSPALEAASGQSVPRVHNVDPADMVRQLERKALETGKVDLRKGVEARRLIRNEGGRVVGVHAVENGEAVDFHADKAVLLAAGGFVHDREMIHRYVPLYDDAVFIGGEGNDGGGLRMALAMGADMRDLIYIKGTFGKHPLDENNHHACLAVYKGAIAVNQDGHRFVDESLSYKLLGDACMRQPYGVTYQILDQNVFELGDNRVRILDFQRRLDEGALMQADSLEQLARQIEVPEAVLLETVNEYNAAVRDGKPDAFGRRHLVHEFGELTPIERGPFYVHPSTAAVFGTYCGLCIDPEMHVIDVFGERIDGLLAAGEIVGGLHGAAYMTGSALGKAAIFGRIAARTAVGGA